jgi:hypothetical protein
MLGYRVTEGPHLSEKIESEDLERIKVGAAHHFPIRNINRV